MSLEKFIQDNRAAFDSETPQLRIWNDIQQELDSQETDRLRSFVTENRSDFDDQAPPKFSFTQNSPIAVKPHRLSMRPAATHLKSWWLQAAVVMILIGAGLWAGRMLGYQDAQNHYLAVVSQIQPDFLEAEAYYQQNIATMSSVIYQHTNDPRLITDIEDMDRAIEELRQELLHVPPQQQAMVVADLIKTYRIKLEILQTILNSLPEATGANKKVLQYENNEI